VRYGRGIVRLEFFQKREGIEREMVSEVGNVGGVGVKM
jgi:hypothetical protein